ncbi:hypothetical protein Tco_1570992 [Tanacetum coccineum]
MDTLEQKLTKETILESNCQNAFRLLKTQFEKIFTSVLIKPSSLDGTYARKYFHAYTGMERQLFKETTIKNFDFIEDYMLKTIILAQTIQKMLDDKKLQIQECIVQKVKALDVILEDKAQEHCMMSFRLLHSHLKLLSNNDLEGTRTEYGFKRAFTTLFGQDLETFTGTMFLNMNQLEKQLDNKEFQEIGSMASFKVLETQFQIFIKSRIYLDDEYVVMTPNYFLQYTQLEILEFRDTLIQHMESVKKSIDERALHKREYDTTVNERQMQTKEGKVDTCKALDDRQQHTEQPEFNNEGEVDQNAEQCHDTCPLPAKLTDIQITELSYQSLESEIFVSKRLLPNFKKIFLRMEAHCVNLKLKYQNQVFKEEATGWMSKKQDCTAMSLAEAEYVALSTSCAQVMWMRTQLKDYGFNYNKISLLVLKDPKDSYKDGDGDTSFQLSQIHHYMLTLRLQRHTIWYDENVYDLRSVETEFPAIVFNDNLTSNKTLFCEPTISSLNNNEIDFRISFDESDDEDYTVVFDKNSFSYKIISANDLKTGSENDNEKVNMPSFLSPKPLVSCIDDLDFFKDFENEFPAIVYNDALTSKSDFSTKPTLCP